MIIKYAQEIKEEVEMCMMIKDSIDDEKVSWQKQFDRLTCFLCEEQTMWRRWPFCVKFDFYVGITIMVHINGNRNVMALLLSGITRGTGKRGSSD